LSSSAPFVSPSGTVKGSRLTTYRLVQIIGATSINPSHERKKQKTESIAKKRATQLALKNSFENITLEWWEQRKDGWTTEHANAVLYALKADVILSIGALPVDTITPPMIHDIIRSIEKREALEMARKALQRTTAVFRYAVQTGRTTYNPATEMKGILKNRKVIHHNALNQEDLPQFLKTLTASNIHVTTKLALQFTILTAARSGEVRGATWEEIDLEDSMWTIPAERMKMNTQHIVPLSK